MARRMRSFDLGFLIAALGALAWVIAGLYYSSGTLAQFVVGLGIVGIGFALTSWGLAGRRWVAVVGLVLVIGGMLLFVGPGLLRFNNLARIASHVFMGGILVAVAGVLLRRELPLRIGAATGVLSSVLWIVADMDGGLAWQPGNLIVLVGFAYATLRPSRGRPTRTPLLQPS